jgi:hypothetical protein
MNARIALGIMVALTVAAALVRFFQRSWVLGAATTAVIAGTGFIGASLYLSDRDDRPRTAQSASKLRAIGFILIGLGTLFGGLMLFV